MADAARIVEQLQGMLVPVATLNQDPANARKHGDKNLDAIKASLAKFGQRKPIVVQRDGMIVRAGNGTLAAAKALGWTEIAAVVLDDDDATARQFAIADNRTAELGEWNDDILTFELDQFPDLAADLSFGIDSLDDLEEEPHQMEVRPVDTIWIVTLCQDADAADKVSSFCKSLGLKVAVSEHRQQ